LSFVVGFIKLFVWLIGLLIEKKKKNKKNQSLKVFIPFSFLGGKNKNKK